LHSEDENYLNNLYQNYKKNYRRTFGNLTENNKRFQIFKENVKKITKHNKAYLNGTQSFHQRVNQHSDKVHLFKYILAFLFPFYTWFIFSDTSRVL
jgi:Fe2+ transport system protein B